MKNTEHHISLELVLKSFENDFDATERNQMFQILKNNEFEDDGLAGVKMLLEENNWDFQLVNEIFKASEKRIDFSVIAHQNKKKNFEYLKYAAIFVPFIAIVAFYFSNNSNTIEHFYIKEKGLPNLMANQTVENNWDKLMKSYKLKNYEKAYATVLAINEIKTQNDTAIYFKGIIAYELEKLDVANKSFQEVLTFENSVFKYDAEFRLGFSLYSSNRKKEAKTVFLKIQSEKENPFQEEASKIIASFF